MGGLQVHNHATTWPNLQDGTCKNSIKIESQVGPECGKNTPAKSQQLPKNIMHKTTQKQEMEQEPLSILEISHLSIKLTCRQ